MIEYIGLALLKILDNSISAAKSIASNREMALLSSFLVILSQFFFFLVIDQVVNDGTLLVITIAAISSGVGNLLVFLINNKFKRDAKWSVVLTCSCMEDVMELCRYLVEHKIKYTATNGYDKEFNETIVVMAFSKTKEESRLIDEYLENTAHKYFKEVLK